MNYTDMLAITLAVIHLRIGLLMMSGKVKLVVTYLDDEQPARSREGRAGQLCKAARASQAAYACGATEEETRKTMESAGTPI